MALKLEEKGFLIPEGLQIIDCKEDRFITNSWYIRARLRSFGEPSFLHKIWLKLRRQKIYTLDERVGIVKKALETVKEGKPLFVPSDLPDKDIRFVISLIEARKLRAEPR